MKAATTRLVIDNGTGSVGIGTESPTAQLTLGQTATAAQTFAFTRTASMNTYYLASDGYNGYLDFSVSADNQKSIIRFLNQKAASTAPTESMRIDTAGNIGIGTTAPASVLQVAGNSSINNKIQQKKSSK